MINLFTSYYIAKSKIRQDELLYCLQKNIDNSSIDFIYIVIHGGFKILPLGVLENKKVGVLIQTKDEKPTYAEYFKMINAVTMDGDINILSNSDIYFDKSIPSDIKPDVCYALSRWEVNPDKSEFQTQVQVYGDSQDVWMFKGRIKPVGFADFPMGKMGCDNRIAHELSEAGYNVFNPSLTIKTWHYHCSNERGYSHEERTPRTVVQPPYKNISVTY